MTGTGQSNGSRPCSSSGASSSRGSSQSAKDIRRGVSVPADAACRAKASPRGLAASHAHDPGIPVEAVGGTRKARPRRLRVELPSRRLDPAGRAREIEPPLVDAERRRVSLELAPERRAPGKEARYEARPSGRRRRDQARQRPRNSLARGRHALQQGKRRASVFPARIREFRRRLAPDVWRRPDVCPASSGPPGRCRQWSAERLFDRHDRHRPSFRARSGARPSLVADDKTRNVAGWKCTEL